MVYKEAFMMMEYDFRNVNGHVEVYTGGKFLFSADSTREAMAELGA